MPSSGELVVVVSLSSRALQPHGSKMARNMILNRGVSASLIAWRTWGGQHEDRLKAEVIEIGLKKRSACVFEARASAQAADGAANIGTRSVTCACWPSG